MAKGIGDVIYNLLSNDGPVSTLVDTNIFPFLAIEDIPAPYIVFESGGVEPTDTKDGVSCLDKEVWDVSMYSETLAEVEDLADKVRTVLDRYSGTVETLVIQSTTFQGEDGAYDDEDRLYIKVQSYSFRIIKS